MLTLKLTISVVHRRVFLICNTSSAEEINIAPGERKKPNSSLTEELYEALDLHISFQQVNMTIQLKGI